MSKKKRMIFILLAVIINLATITGLYFYNTYLMPREMEGSSISIMIEDDSGNYVESNDDIFPTEGYLLNLERSHCISGGDISQNNDTYAVTLKTNVADRCQLYFDKDDSVFSLESIIAQSKGMLSDFSQEVPEIDYYIESIPHDYNTKFTDTNRYITYADEYTFDPATGYSLVSPKVCLISSCKNQLNGKYIVTPAGSADSKIDNSLNLKIMYLIKSVTDNELQTTVFRTENVYKTEGGGIYEMADDYGTSYYFRGIVDNNYVKFGKWNQDVYWGYNSNKLNRTYDTLEECQSANDFNLDCKKISMVGKDMWWRIIRINGDGSLRLLYYGTGDNMNYPSAAYAQRAYNASHDDAKYVGWMYAPAGATHSSSKVQAQTNTVSSDLKVLLDKWYKTNFVDNGYSPAVSDNIFCNDRSTPNSSHAAGYGTVGSWTGTSTDYGAYNRFITNASNPQPTFKCPQKNDAFTVSDTTKGNGALTYPIGLITADEVLSAGVSTYRSTYDDLGMDRNGNYIRNTIPMLTMTPREASLLSSSSLFDLPSFLLGTKVSNGFYIYPVINLSAAYANTMIGNGTLESPYRAPK